MNMLVKIAIGAAAIGLGVVAQNLIANGAALYTVETRSWNLCNSHAVALNVGDVYEQHGAEAAFFTWEQHVKDGFCEFRRGETMTPIEIVFRARDLSVVKVRDDAGKDYYWVTLESLEK